jgi:60 kDa SS-A/Ro ribonucleoprotein
MALIPTKQFDTRSTKRSKTLSVHEPIPDKGQVQNSDGGYVWQVNDWDKLTRFLILGTEGGTYYIAEKDLLKQGHDAVLRCIKANGVKTVQEIVDVSTKGRAYKNDPAIFALALVVAHGDANARMEAYAALPKVCRIGTHLYHFMQYCAALRGTGSGFRRAVGRWFTAMDANKLAMQVVKYQQRDGWSARDVLRVAHPQANDLEQQAVFRWIISGMDGLGARTVTRKVKGADTVREYPSVKEHLPSVIEAFEKAKKADEKELIKLIIEHNLPREAVPTEKLNSVAVWEALLQKMPLTAMIRNLGKMTSIGLLKPLGAATKLVQSKLENGEALKKSRVHPMQVLIASKIYGQGHGDKGDLKWSPIPSISGALDQAFYATFPNVIPCNKPLLIALDVSGSMTSPMQGTALSSCEAVAALSLVHANVEPECHVFGFADSLRELGIRKGMTLETACAKAQMSNFGSTNVSLAFEFAIKEKLDVGGFIVMTDCEVNQGPHPTLRLRAYREKFVPDARCVVVGTCANDFSVNDPTDKWGLDVVGFDASAPPLIADFIRGGGKVVEDAAE